MGEIKKIAAVTDLKPGTGKVCEVGDKQIALFHVDGKFVACNNTCPHRGGPLGEGDLAGTVVTCPWHGWQFDVVTGVSPVNPAAKIVTYPVKVEQDAIFVEV